MFVSGVEAKGWGTPYSLIETDLVDGIPDLIPGYKVPNPESPRACHIDLGLTGNACGFAVGHVCGHKTLRSRDPRTDQLVVEQLPLIIIDVVLRIIPPIGGEIEFAQVQEVL